MSNIDWFRFENKDLDFPFYKRNPHIPKWGWIVLFFALFFGLIFTSSSNLLVDILGCAILIVPVLYFLKWDYKAIFQNPRLKDVGLAVALFVGYIVYSIVVSMLLENFGIIGGNLVEPSAINFMSIPPLIFSMMGEEFVKFIPFMFFLRLIYKFSDNRKLSVILAMIIIMLLFASLHAFNWRMLVFAIFIQGFGSIFEFIGYIKTKNIFIPYITHLCTDLFIYMLAIFAF